MITYKNREVLIGCCHVEATKEGVVFHTRLIDSESLLLVKGGDWIKATDLDGDDSEIMDACDRANWGATPKYDEKQDDYIRIRCSTRLKQVAKAVAEAKGLTMTEFIEGAISRCT